ARQALFVSGYDVQVVDSHIVVSERATRFWLVRRYRCRSAVVPLLLRAAEHRTRREGAAATLSGLMTPNHLTNRSSRQRAGVLLRFQMTKTLQPAATRAPARRG